MSPAKAFGGLEEAVRAGVHSDLELAWNNSWAVSVNQIIKPTDIGKNRVETT
ncbi:MAG: hypothetical protein ACLPY3_13010 [Solirubrobacteraceae bacterium]